MATFSPLTINPRWRCLIDTFLTLAALALIGTVLLGLVRVARGPSVQERLMGVALLSSTGTAVLLLLAVASDTPALRDSALALVALAALMVAVRALALRERP